jgi:hypothetical protein
MNILKVRITKILNFKSSRLLLSTLFVRKARRYPALALESWGALVFITAKIAV